jgi:hypothetical protein
MKVYQYQIVKYRHDIATGEFVNVGVVVYSAMDNYLNVKVLNKYTRISNFFTDADGKYIKEKFQEVKRAIQGIASNLSGLFITELTQKTLTEITSKVLPPDDGSLYFSEPKQGIDIDLDIALEDLFERYVNKYYAKSSNYNTDEKVWKELYKKYFDEYEITQQLTSHTVKTPEDEFEFERAYKNGIWHIYEPLSFDLQDAQDIKNKVYKWVGKINELTQNQEELAIYFLTNMPQKPDLQKFIKRKLNIANSNILHIEIVEETKAEEFAKQQKIKINHHHTKIAA